MILCNENCIPCCDFCAHAIHDEWDDKEGKHHIGGPIGCRLHTDQIHQDIAAGCGHCEDFHCSRAEE